MKAYKLKHHIHLAIIYSLVMKPQKTTP